jgi:hypothetical protein
MSTFGTRRPTRLGMRELVERALDVLDDGLRAALG